MCDQPSGSEPMKVVTQRASTCKPRTHNAMEQNDVRATIIEPNGLDPMQRHESTDVATTWNTLKLNNQGMSRL
jgi:hypothetical protein